MDYLPYFVQLGACLMAVIACPFLIVMLLRSHKIPECFSCGATKMRPSRASGLLDSAAGYLLLSPYRCAGCRERFHAFWPIVPSGEPVVAHGQRLIRVAIGFRKGFISRISIRVVHVRPAQPFADYVPQ